MYMTAYDIGAVAVVALVTALTRGLPFLAFGKMERPPKSVIYLGKYLPGAIMTLLVIYSLRNEIYTFPESPGIFVAIGIFILQLIFKNTFLSMAAGTVAYMIIINF